MYQGQGLIIHNYDGKRSIQACEHTHGMQDQVSKWQHARVDACSSVLEEMARWVVQVEMGVQSN